MHEHVVIAGGGVGALEGLLALQAYAGDALRISLLTPSRHLTYRALAVREPFGGPRSPRFDWERITRDRGVRWIPDRLEAVRPDVRELETRGGPPVPYDALLLALGARQSPAVPGALSFGGPGDVLAVGEAISALAPGGARRRIVFVVPTGVTWSLPLYELALMTAARVRDEAIPAEIVVVTREGDPLEIFGSAASRAVARRLLDEGIHVRTGTFALEYDAGSLWLELEGPLEADLVVALPRLAGPLLPGVTGDPEGFVPVDAYGRVAAMERVWAVGDMTTHQVRQGGLATQQADVAAADIAATVAGADITPTPYHPTLRGLLLTGSEPLYLERRGQTPAGSEAAGEFLWWPPHKVVGRHLGPYLDRLAGGAALGT